ncbi:MAG: hypothetical protein WAM39_09270 [Bryobacteraceae bacterium]
MALSRAFIGLILLSAVGVAASGGDVTFGGLSMSNPAPTFDKG